jgi:hypothetical protein
MRMKQATQSHHENKASHTISSFNPIHYGKNTLIATYNLFIIQPLGSIWITVMLQTIGLLAVLLKVLDDQYLVCCHTDCRFALSPKPAQVTEHLSKRHSLITGPPLGGLRGGHGPLRRLGSLSEVVDCSCPCPPF